MDEYIKREDAIMTAMNYEGSGNAQDASQDIAAEIASIPAADVRENVRGEWIDEKFWGGRFYCSCCNYGWPYITGVPKDAATYNFCPNCGADMRGDVDGH